MISRLMDFLFPQTHVARLMKVVDGMRERRVRTLERIEFIARAPIGPTVRH